MIIWFSLVAALVFGGQTHAAHHMGMRNPQATSQAPATTSSADASVTTGSPPTITPTFFHTNWNLPSNITLLQNATFGYTVTQPLEDEAEFGSPVLVLCQTGASGAETLDSSNTWSVVQITGTCLNNVNGKCAFDVGVFQTATIGFVPGQNIQSLDNFFLCFGSASGYLNTLTCESYSPFFNIEPANVVSGNLGTAAPPTATPTVPIFLPKNTPVVNVLGVSSASALSSNYATWSSVYLTATASPSQTPTQAASSPVSQTLHKSKGLSTGALIGIIVGAVGAALILALLSLLCLRRRRRTRTRSGTADSHTSFQPEHVLLTQPYHSVSGGGSRDLMTEKDTSPTTLTSILETPLTRPALPQNPRHSYDSLNASAPYSGLAAVPPKRKQVSPPPPVVQNIHQQSLLSRGISDASGPLARGLSDASGPISPRSTMRGEGEEFEEYHDVPIYGDARHTPTVYESHPSLLQAPFLSEEGMSAEEIARLEEEERRIDAAIEEAERERR